MIRSIPASCTAEDDIAPLMTDILHVLGSENMDLLWSGDKVIKWLRITAGKVDCHVGGAG
jgi:hypothetical protein